MRRRTGAAAVAAAAIYAAMWIGYLHNWAWLSAVDTWFLDVFRSIGVEHPALVNSWNVFCTLLGPTAFRMVGVGLIIWLLTRRYLRPALFLVVSVELGGLVTEVAKHLADRPRPDTALVHAPSTSFPSGHAVGVMVGVLAFLTILLPFAAQRWRTRLIVLGAAVVVLIGIGRVVLNVHHPSDVVAGWALGFVWYAACMQMLRPLTTAPPAGRPSGPGSAR